MVIRVTGKKGNIGPSLKGRLYSYQNKFGHITASWPKPRGKARSEAQQWAQDRFTEACKIMKLMPGDFIAYAAENCKGKPMLPRDALMAALYGRGPVIYLPSGRVIRPMATRIDMSTMMDNLAWGHYDMLYRTEDTWVGLHAPDYPGFLAFDPSQGYLWVDANDVGGGDVWMIGERGSQNNINSNFKANQLIPFADFLLNRVALQNNWGNEANCCLWLFKGNTSNDILGDLIWNVMVPQENGPSGKIVEVPIPPTIMQKGQRYFIGVSTLGASATANTVLFTQNPPYGPLPILPDPARYQLNDDTPSPGQTMSFGSGANTFCIFLGGQ